MIDLLKLKGLKRRRLTSVLGLALDGSRLEGVVLRRTNGSVSVQESFSVTLSLDPLIAEPELVGREILNHLNAAGVRERQCVVCVPLKWALTVHTETPDLAPADAASFIQLEAERGFPTDVESLHYQWSECRLASGNKRITLVGIPRSQVALLEQALRAARLKPHSFSLGINALQPADSEISDGVMALAIGENHVALQITTAGGVAALRALEGAIEVSGSREILHADLVAREARITLGQLPEELRNTIKRVRIFGPRELANQLAEQVQAKFEPMGLKTEVVSGYVGGEFRVNVPAGATVSRAFSAAVRRLSEGGPAMEFLPPKVTAIQAFSRRYASGKLQMASGAAAALLLMVASAFGFQQWQLSRLQSRWRNMEARVLEVEKLQQQIRVYRPWYDDSLRGMNILKQLTLAFPEEGAVSAKMVEIRDMNAVSCSGIARDNQAWLRTYDQLRSSPKIADLKVNQIRGRSPIQFTFDFKWSEGGAREN